MKNKKQGTHNGFRNNQKQDKSKLLDFLNLATRIALIILDLFDKHLK